MFNLFNRGLTKEDIAKTLKKIRKEYNNYIITYMRPPRVKEEFESRYFFAAKYKENMAYFFKNEILILNDLIKVEKDKKTQIEKDRTQKNKRIDRIKNGSFADKVLKEFEERIKIYPEIDISEESSIEIRKLFGGFQVFEDQYWNHLSRYIKTATPEGKAICNLENDLWNLIGTPNRKPPALDRYLMLLENPYSDLKGVSFAAQECMKQCAFFLHDIIALYQRSILDVTPPQKAIDGYNYINKILFNFRLNDLKRN